MPEGEEGQESQSQPVAPKGQARKQSLIQASLQGWKAGHEGREAGREQGMGGCDSTDT